MKEKTRDILDSLTPEMIDKTMEKVEIKDIPDDISAERIKNRVLAATGLEEKCEEKPKTKHRSFFIKMIPAAAACLALIVAVSAMLPSVLNKNNCTYIGSDNPVETDNGQHTAVAFKIRSLSMLNYYAADKMLHNPDGYEHTIPADADISEPSSGYVPTAPETSEKSLTYSSGSEMTYVDSYSINPDEVYEIFKVIRFKINLTNSENEIAEHLGTGIITVTITENTFMNMLTFEKDGNFYSVCDNSLQPSALRFYSVKFIDGFNISKIQVSDYFVFDFLFDEDGEITKIDQINNITGFRIGYIKGSPEEIPSYSISTDIVEGSLEIAEGHDTFTLRELESLYN